MTNAENATPKSPGTGSTLRIVLFASLALNMFLLGAGAVTIGRSLSHPDRPHFFGGHDFPGPNIMLRSLPSDERARLERAVGPQRQAMRDAVMTARRARREAFGALGDQNYSAKAMEGRLQAMRAADLAAVNAVHDLLAVSIDNLSPEDRALVLKAIGNHAPPPDGP
jgi:uncharacterized membrane protein